MSSQDQDNKLHDSDSDFEIESDYESGNSDITDSDSDSEVIIPDSVWRRVYPPEDECSGTKFSFLQRHIGPVGVPVKNAHPIECFFIFE